MSLSSLSLFSSWRDFSGDWNALVEPQIAPLESSSCHAPRFVLVPDVSHNVFPASGKIEYNFHLIGGSLIYGLWVPNKSYAFQLTDVTLGHAFFQDPIRAGLIFTAGALQGRIPGQMLLPSPHPVVGDGLFSFEAWGTPGDTVVVLLSVAEVTECPVR
jgi:hypothetical protein